MQSRKKVHSRLICHDSGHWQPPRNYRNPKCIRKQCARPRTIPYGRIISQVFFKFIIKKKVYQGAASKLVCQLNTSHLYLGIPVILTDIGSSEEVIFKKNPRYHIFRTEVLKMKYFFHYSQWFRITIQRWRLFVYQGTSYLTAAEINYSDVILIPSGEMQIIP